MTKCGRNKKSHKINKHKTQTTISNVLERGLIITDPDDVSKESDGDTVWNSSVFVSHELNTKTIVNKANK